MQVAVLLIGVAAILVYTRWFVADPKDAKDDKMSKRSREDVDDSSDEEAKSGGGNEPERVVKRLRTLETSLNLIRKALLDDDSGTNKADTATLDQLVAMRRDIDALSTKLQAAHGSDANIERVAEAIRNILEESQKKLRDQIALHDKVLAEQPKRVANVTAELRANLNRQAERLADLRSEVERGNSKLGELALLVEGDGKKIDTDRAKLAELTKRHDDLEQSIRSLRDLLDQDEVEDETLGRRVAEISLRLTRLDGAASGTSKRVGEIEVVAKTANERIDALTTSTTQRLADLETNVTKVATEEVRKTNERVAEMDVATAKRLTDLESNVTRLEDQELAKTNERVERLEQLDSTISTRLSGLEDNVTKVSGEDIVEDRKKMEMIDTRVVALEDRGKQHEDKLEDVENRLSGAEKQLVKCCSNVHNLFNDHKMHALTQAELFENRYAVVEKNGTELRQQVDAYKKKLEDQEVRQNRLEQDELTLRTRVDVCERTGQDLNNHIEKQDARNETTVKELHELDKRTGTLEKQTADTDTLVQRHDTHLIECEKALRVLENETRSNRSACDAANIEIVETVREQAQKISAFESQTTELKMHATECDKRFDEIGGRVQQTSEKLVAVEVALQTRVNETEKQMERLTTRTQTYAEQLSGLNAQTKGMRGELDGTAQRLTNAEQSVRDWRQQVERQLVEIEPLPEKMEALRQTVNQTDTTLAAKLDEQTRRADKNEETCQRETNALRRDIVENDALAKQLQKRIDKIESAASELNKSSELHAIKLSQLSALHDANAPQMKKMADLEHDSVQLAQDVAELQKRSAELQEEVKLLHSKDNERKAQDAHHATVHAEEVARLREEFSGGVERSEKAIRDDLRALAATAERDSASRVDLVNKVDALTVELEDKPTRAEFELVKTELKNNLDQLTSNVSQQKDTNQRAEDQERQLHALRAELTAQSASLIGLRGELNTLDLPQVRSVTEQLRQWREKTDRILDRFIVQVEKAEKAEADAAAAAAALTKEAAKSDSALPTGATVGTTASTASTGTNGVSCEAVKAELEELSEKVEKKLSGLAEKAAEKEKTEKERVEQERDAKEKAEKEKALARLVRSVSPTRVEENTAAIKRIDESVIKLTKTDLPKLREELNRGDKVVRRLTDEDLPKLREELMKNNANALESAIKTLSAKQDSLRERMLVEVKDESAKKLSEALHKLGEVRNVSRETTLRTALKSMQNDIDKATRKLLSSRDALHNTAQKELRDGLRDELQKRIETAITELAHKQDELREKTLSVVQQNEKKEHDRTRSDIVSLRSKIESAESELKKRIAEDKKVNDQLSSLRKTIDREKSDIRSHLTKKLRESTSEHESKWSSAITAAKKAIAKDRDASRDADLAELHTKTKKECTERIEKALAQAKHDCTEHQSKLRESVEQASKALLDKTTRELVKKRDDSRAKVLAEISTRLEKHCNESLTAAAAKIRTEATAIVAKETTKVTGEISKRVDTELSKSHKSADEALQKGLKTLRTDLEKRVDSAVSKVKSDRDASRKKSLQDLQTALKKHVADELKLWNDKRDKTETDRVRRTIEYYKYTTNESLDDTFKKRDEKRKEQIAAAQTETTKKVTAELQKSLTKRDEEAKKTTEQIRADFKKAIETAIAKVHSERNESRAKAFKEKLAATLESTENNSGSGKKMNEKDMQTMRALIHEQMNVFALSLTTSILRDFHLVTEHVESELKQFREERKKYTKQELMQDHEQRAKQLERDSRLAAIEHLLGRNFDNVPLNTYVATIVHKELDREQRLPSSDTQAIRKAITRYGSFDAFLDRRINQFLRSHFSPEDVEDILRVRDNDFVYDMKKKIVELEEQVKNLLKGESKRADDASTVRSQFLRFEERFLTTFNELEARIEKRYDIKKPVLAQTDRGRLMDLEHKLAESEQERKKLDERLQFLEHVFKRFKELRKIDSPLKAFNLVDDWTTKTT